MLFAEDFWLYLILLLPLVWLVMRATDRGVRRRLERLLGRRASQHVEGLRPRTRAWRRFLLFAGLFWLLLALARPQWGAREVAVSQRGSDIVIALDISNSMLAEDVLPNRMERAKAELAAFLRRLEDSRVGLVFFAGGAFVQCPLTLDYGTAEIFLKMADPDMLSEQGTAIGSALETARSLLAKGREDQSRGNFQAILLVTDGEDLEGKWEDAARACRDEGIRLIPVGVGEEGGGLIPMTDAGGQAAGFLKDDEGNVVMTRLDMASLESMAAIGGGSPFRVGVDGLAGDRLFAELERLGKRDLEERRISAYEERFVWPALLAALCLLLRLVLGARRRMTGGTAPAALAAVLLVMACAGDARAIMRPPGGEHLEAGRDHYLAEDYEAALNEFASALVAAPEDPLASLAMGETLFQLERFEEADREFVRTLELTDDPELRAEALYNGGTTALAQDDLEAAVDRLREALRLDPDQLDALVNLETALRRQQQQEQQQQQEGQDQQDQPQEQQGDQQNQQEQDPQNQQEQQDQEQQDQENPQQQQDQQEQPEQEQEQEQQSEPQEQPGEQEQEEQDQGEPEEQELTPEQAMQLLQALDRDEEELKKSVQKRLRGGRPKSGKKW